MTSDQDGPLDDLPEAPQSRMLVWVSLAVVAVVVLVGAGLLVVAASGGSDDAETVVIDIPDGTGERMDAGEDVELIPREMQLDVGDTLLIENEDDRVHTVGPYVVAPGQSLTQTYTETGRVEGGCTLHPSGRFAIVIS